MTNMNPDAGKFFMCSFLLVLTAQAAMAFGKDFLALNACQIDHGLNAAVCILGHFLSAAAPTATAATSLAGPFLGALMIFSGLFLNNS